MRILLVEDDESLVDALTSALTRQNYVVDVAIDGEAGWEMAESYTYDLILLDVMLPKLDGIHLCRRLRQKANSVPLMLLTAKDSTDDTLIGLDAGADDYVVKPFELDVLSARIRALLRRGTQAIVPMLTWGTLILNPNSREIQYGDAPLHFSRREYQILELFLRNPERVLNRRSIVEQVWSFDEDPPTEDTIKSHIKSIRRKFKALGAENIVETLYGQGYRLNPDYQTAKPILQSASDSTDNFPIPSRDDPPLVYKERELATELAEIWQRTKGSTLSRVQDLTEILHTLSRDRLTETQQQQAIRTAHKLVGSLGTFGFKHGSQLAKELEGLFQTTCDAQNLLTQAKPLIEELQTILTDDSSISAMAQAEHSRSFQTSTTLTPQRSLLVVEPDETFCKALRLESSTWKIAVSMASNLNLADRVLQDHVPDVVLLNIDCVRSDSARERFLQTLSGCRPSPAFLALSNHESLTNRLQALELGAQTLLQKPTTPTQVFMALNRALEIASPLMAKVLVVDDDVQILDMVQRILRSKGFQTFGLQQSEQFWETLKTVQPDLLILDISMPGVNGLSLCQLVRNDFQWSWLPIIFLTGHTSVQTLQKAFFAGADDFITKPILHEEFVVRVMNRLQRSRLYRNQMEIDVLTGIANRRGGTRNFDQLLHLAIQSQRPLCLAALDLDHFKQVNDRYGHEEGDRVLHEFGEFLKRKCRTTDVLARWGGEEFIVGMLGLTREKGVQRMTEILQEWRAYPLHTTQGKLLQVSFSAGIAQYPLDGVDFQVLYRTADAALYKAKAAGRNRVIPAG